MCSQGGKSNLGPQTDRAASTAESPFSRLPVAENSAYYVYSRKPCSLYLQLSQLVGI